MREDSKNVKAEKVFGLKIVQSAQSIEAFG